MKHVNIICSLVTCFLLILKGNAQLPGDWPELDTPPPYIKGFDGLVDFTKVPGAPVKKSSDDCPQDNDPFCDWSCTGCTRDTDVVECPTVGDWGLTFDDGPTEYTDTLLDYLETQNLTITFFVVGSRVFENPQILVKAVKAGHQIGVHTWSHPSLTTQSNEQIVAEMQWTAAIIKAAVGLTPTYMRPPYGDYDDRVRNIVSQLGYKPTVWDKDTGDWESDGNQYFQYSWIESNFTEWVKESSTTGHISLEHDLYERTAAQAPRVVPILQGRGFNVKPVAACMGDDRPYVESVNSSSSAVPSPTSDDSSSLYTTTGDSSSTTTDNSPSSTTNGADSSSSGSNMKINFSLILIITLLILISCMYI